MYSMDTGRGNSREGGGGGGECEAREKEKKVGGAGAWSALGMRCFQKGTRRVELVRRDGRDVSTLYGRGDAGRLGGRRTRAPDDRRARRAGGRAGWGGLGAAGSLYVEGDSGVRVVGVLVSRVELRARLAACGRRAPRVTGPGFVQRECRAGGGATAAAGDGALEGRV